MTNIQKQYPFSPGTIEGEALENLPSKQQAAILQNTEVWDEANKINDEINRVLVKKQEEEEKVARNKLYTEMIMEKIADKNHPRLEGLIKWIENNPDNQEWVERNIGINFDLVLNGIMILGDVFELEDEKAPDRKFKGIWVDGMGRGLTEEEYNTSDSVYRREYTKYTKDIWNEWGCTKFNFDAAKVYVEKLGKSIPVWEKYNDFLPGDELNKEKFFKNVLGLYYNGEKIIKYWSGASFNDDSEQRYVLAMYNTSHSAWCGSTGKYYGLFLRCIKRSI